MQDNIFVFPRSQAPSEPGLAVPNNLPAQLTPFIGREAEVTDICALLRRPEVHLLTLTGTGGVGKTRLGLEVAAHMLEDFPDGVYFVSLAPLSQPDLVLPTLAQTFHLKATPDWLPLEHLKSYLHDKQLLLLLDNFEQVVAVAPVLVALLQACPALKLLVTSRVRLHVSGEYEFTVQPFALPDPHHLPEHTALLEYAAVALFVQRAQAIKPTFELTDGNALAIAEICRHLDGLPLGIELAAARIKLLSPQALLARLSHRLQVLTGGVQDAPVRQQTLRNTIAWSYDLLDASEQRLFRRLSVFVGGCTLEAVEALYDTLPDGEAGQVLEKVTSLLDKSLLRQSEQEDGESRLLMLETLREYALECLHESGEAEAVQRAHAHYYLHLAEEAGPHLKGDEQLIWLARLARELENLRVALGRMLEHEEGELALRLSGALWWFWFMHGDWREGRRWLEAALQLPSAQKPTVARAVALSGAGELAWSLGDHLAAQHLLSESVTLSRELGDDQGLAGSLGILGLVLQEQGELAAGGSGIEEGLALCRRLGRTWDLARLLLNAGLTAHRQGNYPQSAALFEEGFPLAQEVGERYLIAYGLTYAWIPRFHQGDETQAVAMIQEGLTMARELGDKRFIADGLSNLGYVMCQQGDPVQAAALFQEALTIARELGHTPTLAVTLLNLAEIAFEQGDAKQAETHYRESFSFAWEDKYLVWARSSLMGLAMVAEAQGQPMRAARLLGAVEALIDDNNHLRPAERVTYERDVARIRSRLGEEAFTAAWAEGRAMTPEQALAAPEQSITPESVPAVPQSLPEGKPILPSKPTYPAGLTAREMEILRLVAQGMTNPQIAERLILSLHTVNAHVRSIYNKIEVNSRSALTRYALEQHLL